MSDYLLMRRDLVAPITAATLPAGFTLAPFTRDRADACRELMKRVYPGGLGDNGISFDGFWSWLINDPEYDPTLMFVAQANGAVAGFCHCWTSNFVKDLVVAPEFRKRGLGSALLTIALNAFVTRGARAVELKTEVNNIGARSLYRHLGFAEIERVSVEH